MKVCTVPDCGEKKLATTPGDYCKNHTCQDANCLRLRKYRSGTTYEKFCYRRKYYSSIQSPLPHPIVAEPDIAEDYVAPRLKCTKTPCNNYRLFDSEFCEQRKSQSIPILLTRKTLIECRYMLRPWLQERGGLLLQRS